MDKAILLELEEAMRTKNVSWMREIQKMLCALADDIELSRAISERDK